MKGLISGFFVVLITTIVAVVVILISVGLYFFAVNILKFDVSVVSPLNKPFYASEILFHQEIEGRPFLEHVLMASLAHSLQRSNSENVPKATVEFLERYGFDNYLVFANVKSTAANCTTPFSNSHKAIDLSADCGTPVRALCNGHLERGVSGQSQKILNGGVILDKLKNCEGGADLSKQRIFYACIEESKKQSRNVRKGDIIGFVKDCDEEKSLGCHLHMQFVEGALGNERQPPAEICNDLQSVLDLGSIILASKNPDELKERSGRIVKVTVPLFYKNTVQKLVVMVE